eukprot:TRINITY_DN706_c0_g1_i1.p1 TRINITY_DN706_c0_g1~~TRINITY_DN706_c0_g1_i1.p1  ORF type:complete len:1941 (-),score=419.45 TRINITY_DN706_c0_g1_i1:667-6414(-)
MEPESGGSTERDKERERRDEMEREREQAKEREKERERDRERMRELRDRAAAAMGAGDEDVEGDSAVLHQNLASASSALHGLLRKLGAGLDDLLPSSGPGSTSSRLKNILAGLRADGDQKRQLDALNQLCDLLSIGTEESLSSFSVDSFVPVLVGLLNCEDNPDMMLLAARALTHLCDVLPSSCAAVVHYGAVPSFCARLLTIEYIDLAEQSLQALEKISHEHPSAVLRAGGLMAVLSYLDFFSTGVQRVAVSTAANICRQLSAESSDLVMEVVPILTNLLQYQDAKVVEHACVCLSRLAEAFASSSEKLDMLCAHGLISHAVRLISVTGASGPQTTLSSSTYTGLVRLLATCAAGSAAVAENLLNIGISKTVHDILAGPNLAASTSVSQPALNRPSEQLYELVSLVNELLPPLPDSFGVPSLRRRGASAVKVEESSSNGLLVATAREKLLSDKPELLLQFGKDLFPVLLQVYGSTVNPPVRYRCLSALSKLLHFGNPEMLLSLLQEANISSFLAGVLASKDPAILNTALQMAEMLMQKLPDVFCKSFVKEGVVHAIDLLIASESPTASQPSAAATAGSSGLSSSPSIAPPRPRRSGSARRRTTDAPQEESQPSQPIASPPIGSPSGGVASLVEVLARSHASRTGGARALAIAQAKKLKETYFSGDACQSSMGLTKDLQKLKDLCSLLSGDAALPLPDTTTKGRAKGKAKVSAAPIPPTAVMPRNDEADVKTVAAILKVLIEGEGVSTFEFIGSGVVEALVKFVTCGNVSREGLDDSGMQDLKERVLRRLKGFMEVAMPLQDEGSGPQAVLDPPMASLVRKLQNALASIERFPVMLNNLPRQASNSGSITAGLRALTQPFKLRLTRAANEKLLRDYSSNIVLIEPLATLAQVEDFLWLRVRRSEPAVPPQPVVAPAVAATPRSVPAPGSATPSAEVSPSTEPSSLAAASVSLRESSRPSTRARSAAAAASRGGVLFGGSNKGGQTHPASLPDVAGGNGGEVAKVEKGKGKAGVKPWPFGSDVGVQTRKAAARGRLESEDKNVDGPVKATVDVEEVEEGDVPGGADEETFPMEEDMPSDGEDEDDEDEDDHDEVFGGELTQVGTDRVHELQLGETSEAAAGSSGGRGVGGSSAVLSLMASSLGAAVAGSSGAGPSGSGAGPAVATGTQGTSATGSLRPSSPRERRSMAAVVAALQPPRLAFSMGPRQLDRSMTIFQAIQRQAVSEEEEDDRYGGSDYPTSTGSGRRLWDEVYTITYRRADESNQEVRSGNVASSSGSRGGSGLTAATGSSVSGAMRGSWQQASLLESIMEGSLPCDLPRSDCTYGILLLLRLLEGLNRLGPRLRKEAALDSFAGGRISCLSELPVMGPVVKREEFISRKLTPKLARQMQDALALCSGGLPAWCQQLTRACPFLFPFETRRQFFYSTAFGLTRALQRLQQQQNADGTPQITDRETRELRIGRLQRQKVRVSRTRILDSAAKVMELYAGHKAVLEVEYFGEVGTGLGPTLEFYTLLSHELQRQSLKLWRSEVPKEIAPDGLPSDTSDVEMRDVDELNAVGNSATPPDVSGVVSASEETSFVHAPHGLFPKPWSQGADRAQSADFPKVVENFRLLGRVVAKALQDSRLLDLPFSPAFYRLALGQELDLYDIQAFDPVLGNTLEEMQGLVRRRQELLASVPLDVAAVEGLAFRGSKVEDMCLDFTLPGQPDFLLKEEGANVTVTLENLEEYVQLVVNATVKEGIQAQLDAFRAGFNQVFSLSSLQLFTEDELDALLCGRKELWTADMLGEHIKFDHGYTAGSPVIRNLLEVMGDFNPEEQRSFLRFVTGAPRLPPGGLSALYPKLTIVRKHPTGGTGVALTGTTPPGAASSLGGTTLADGDLPSVMTCANYLKLPPYSCKEIMRERLLYAIQEGQGSFDLS